MVMSQLTGTSLSILSIIIHTSLFFRKRNIPTIFKTCSIKKYKPNSMPQENDKLFGYQCRACMENLQEEPVINAKTKSRRPWQSIFDTIEECDALGIAELLTNTIPQIKVHPKDELPKNICCKCLEQLVSAHRFQQMCIQCDQQMREMVAKMSTESPQIMITEAIEEDEKSAKEFSVEEIIQETKEQRIEFEGIKTLPETSQSTDADPLQSNDETNEDGKDSDSDVSDLVKNEPCEFDVADIGYSDDETSHSTVKQVEEGNLVPSAPIKREQKTKRGHSKKKLSYSKFKCDICDRYFHRAESLQKHSLAHDENSDKTDCYNCDLCERTYCSSHTLAKHRKVQHPQFKSKQYSCDFCERAFKSPVVLKKHIARTHTNEGYLCPECGKSFKTERKLKGHCNRHREEKSYECPDCPLKFNCAENLRTHRVIHLAKEHKCDICGFAFKKRYILNKHKKNHSGERPYKCDYCEKCFVRPDHKRRHMRIHTGEKPFKCEYCGRAFADHGDRMKHLKRAHVGNNVYRCELCPLKFRLASEMRAHFVTHKNDDEETRERNMKAINEEAKLDTQTAGELNLKGHRLSHRDDKPYECPHCPRRFSCPSYLSSHKNTHGPKQHICHICGSAFKERQKLEKHKKYHIGDKPYKCDYCEMCFVRPDHKRRHMRIHTGEKPYKCKYCDRSCSQSSGLIKHLRRMHLGEKVYRCELCPLTFRLASENRLHFASHKNDDEETRERNMKALKEEEAKLSRLLPEGLQ